MIFQRTKVSNSLQFSCYIRFSFDIRARRGGYKIEDIQSVLF